MKILTMGEVEELPEVADARVRKIIENAYRRGFAQGACATIEAVEKGFSVRKLNQWMARVNKWRNKNHKGVQQLPEWLARDGKAKP